jgi:hypothetical protein
MRSDGTMELTFTGEVISWRGPSPYHFVPLPVSVCDAIAVVAPQVSYGWGVIPVTATIGVTSFATSLFPKDGGYLLPLKDAVRRAEGLDVGDSMTATVVIAP